MSIYNLLKQKCMQRKVLHRAIELCHLLHSYYCQTAYHWSPLIMCSTPGGYHEYSGDIMSTVGGYHEYTGECSVYRGDTMMNVWRYHEYTGRCLVHQSFPTNSMALSTAFPALNHGVLQCTLHPPPPSPV